MKPGVPSNWENWLLGDVGAWYGGGTPASTEPRYWDGDIPWVSPKDMKAFKLTQSIDKITPEAIQNSAAKLIPSGAVLFVTRSGILAHSFPVAVSEVAVTVNQDIKAIKPVDVIDPVYLAWVLRAAERKILSSCSKHGTTVHSIEMPSLKELSVPIPPAPEQRRIVAKIEELFSKLDKGVETLTAARDQLKAYRQSVLKHAFEGKLTEDWRAKNADKLETSETLLVRIKQEREARYQQALDDWESALATWRANGEKGRKPGKPKPLKDFPSEFHDLRITLPDLPNGWTWSHLGWCSLGPEYGTAAKSSETGAVPVVRMGNLQNGRIDWDDLVYTSDEQEIAQYALRPGDVLFNRTNSPELVGKTSIYKGERPALFAGYLVRVNQIESIALGKYLTYFLSSPIAHGHGNTVKTDGVNQSNINGTKLQEYPFPFCSTAEQAEIVRLLEEKLEAADVMEAEIEAGLARAESLRQSILKRAFSGKLVPQDPEDEPASSLLARIRAERAAVPQMKRARGSVRA